LNVKFKAFLFHLIIASDQKTGELNLRLTVLSQVTKWKISRLISGAVDATLVS
jgi:hypothetical protein